MDHNDLILVSVDDHVIEPAHIFDGRLPKQYDDKAPRFVRRSDGTFAWVYEGAEIPSIAVNAVAGRPPEEYGFEPVCIEEIRSVGALRRAAEGWDVSERSTRHLRPVTEGGPLPGIPEVPWASQGASK